MLANINKKKLAVVALSGGVDSSVAALLLKNSGYDLYGVHLRLHDTESHIQSTKSCCGSIDRRDAKKVCDVLDIPFKILDLRASFKKDVIDPFVSEYKAGRTPNPCVRCNEFLKFQYLVNFTKQIGAAYLATGHYAKIEEWGEARVISRARDHHKDQTYFMFSTPKTALPHLLFPNGDYSKEEIRRMAEESGLGVARKPDSQEICFIPDQDHGQFVENHVRENEVTDSSSLIHGNFVNDEGQVLSAHRGIHHYTVGQRRGLGIAHSHRLYVRRIDSQSGNITLSTKDNCTQTRLRAASANWMVPVPHQFSAKIKIRNNHFPADGLVTTYDDRTFSVDFNDPQFAVAKGQGVAVYQNEILMGGGWIES